MLVLIARTLKDNRVSLAIYILICTLFVWMMIAFFPTMLANAKELQEAFANYPKEFLEAFDISSMDTMFTNLEGFLAVEYYSIIWPIIIIILVLSYGSGAIAGEIDRGTIEVLLAQPISRARLYWTKYAAGVIIIAGLVVLSNLSIIPFASLYDVAYQWRSLLLVSVLGFLFSLALFSITMMFSALLSSKGKVASIGGGIVIVMYGLDLVSKFKESVENLKYLSFFHYFDHNAALLDHHIAPLTLAVFLGVGVVCTLIGLATFIKRDIAT